MAIVLPGTAVLLILALGCSMQVGGAEVGGAETEAVPKRVLLLFSHQTNAPINFDWERGIRRALAEGYPDQLKVEVEHLDLGREEDRTYHELLVDLLRHKYSDAHFDVVVPIYMQAFNFALTHRDLFHNAPVVFCSVPSAVAIQAEAQLDTTGVVFTLEFIETVSLARSLFPDARRLLVLSGASQGDRSLRRWAEKSLSPLSDELELEFVSGLPLPSLCHKLAQMDARSIVLVLAYDSDTSGRNYMTTEVVKIIAEHSRAPVFGLYDTLLGHGILGGKLASAETQGALAGGMAVRVLNGEAPENIPATGSQASQYIFDARQLQRWSIPRNQLPPDSQLRYSEVTLWDRYGSYLIGVAVAIAVQTLVIAALVINRSRRMRAEQSLLASRGQARELAGKLLSAQEDERRRLARELHDDLTQRLAAAAIDAGSLEHEAASSKVSQERLTKLKQDLISICEDVHRVSRQIHPAILDDLGLADALRSECDRLADRIQKPVRMRCGELPKEMPMSTAVCLYRIAQEALWNAIKHAQSEEVELTISADDESIHLEIRDWGVGFSIDEANGRPGIGLASMTERTRLVNGSFEIKSAPGHGTVVAVDVPLPESTL